MAKKSSQPTSSLAMYKGAKKMSRITTKNSLPKQKNLIPPKKGK